MYFVFTGPECSGKSTVSRATSSQLDLPLLEERSRLYLHAYGVDYCEDDLYRIANMHRDAERLLSGQDCICDTDILTIEVWMRVVYDKSLGDLQKYMEHVSDRFYLLCKPNIPWVPDPQRESSGTRDELYIQYLDLIRNLGYSYVVLDDLTPMRRTSQAIKSIIDMLNR